MAQKVSPDEPRKQLSSDGIQAALFKPQEAAIATAQACAEAQAPAGVWTSALDLHEQLTVCCHTSSVLVVVLEKFLHP